MDVIRLARRTILVAALPFFGGCFMYATKEDAQIMQKDIADLKAAQKKQDEKFSSELERTNVEAKEQIAKMKELIDEATKVVTRNSANLGQDVDKLKQDLASLTGRAEVLENSVNGLSKSFNEYRASSDTKLEKLETANNTQKTPPTPENPDAVFADAKKAYDAQQWKEARRLFTTFINRYASDTRAPTAQYLIGESYFAEKNFAGAIGAFTKVIENYPKSESVPDAMYKNGLGFYSLKYCSDARTYFQELLRRYPRTDWKKDANEQLKKIQKDLKNKDVCQS